MNVRQDADTPSILRLCVFICSFWRDGRLRQKPRAFYPIPHLLLL